MEDLNMLPGGMTKTSDPHSLVVPGIAPNTPAMPREPRDPLLTERQKTHGDFSRNALISQRLKCTIRNEALHYELIRFEHKEAIDMICLKLSRILSGQGNFKDHWDDIAGYAKLGAEACQTQ